MKTKLLLFYFIVTFLVSLLLFVTCMEKNESGQTSAEQAIAKITNVEHLSLFFGKLNPKDQRQVFVGLPAEFKHALFTNHWENMLYTASTQTAKEYLQGLINNLKPEYYADSLLFESEGADFFSKQVEAGLKVYQNDTSMVASVLFILDGDENAAPFLAWVKPDCECHLKQGVCFIGNCGNFDCKKSKWGCGPGWLWACQGMCLL